MTISKDFVIAGQAVFTVETPTEHYTYMVKVVPPSEKWPKEKTFVYYFTGTDNTNPRHYTYVGEMDKFTGQVKVTPKSMRWAKTFALRILNRILARVWSDDHTAYQQFGFDTHHEGHCGRCGAPLTVPESIKTGLGPVCRKLGGFRPVKRNLKRRAPAGVQ